MFLTIYICIHIDICNYIIKMYIDMNQMQCRFHMNAYQHLLG